MPEMHFKGKEYVYNHHLTVPYRPLILHPDKSVGDETENLIIHADNLNALKALLPRYAGKVDCVFIDPPYNTGEEKWSYNDNVDSPIMREWLESNPVDKEDMLRHDKWSCMMYPRLKLLRELLSQNGSLWMTLDDNEMHRARMILDEIFGLENFVCVISWNARKSVQNDTDISTNNVNYIIGYAYSRRQSDRRLKEKNASYWHSAPGFVFLPKDIDPSRYSNPDNDPRGDWKADPFDAPNVRENLTYYIVNPNTKEKFLPPEGRCWRTEEEKYKELLKDNRIVFGVSGKSKPQLKVFASEKVSYGEIETVWWDNVPTTTDATKALRKIIPESKFDNPKPLELLKKIIFHTTRKDSLVLDCFSGSGTTAHAVLAQNAEDEGRRHFILVECEDHAVGLTTERLRRVIKGYKYQGTQKEELLRERISWKKFDDTKQRQESLDRIKRIEDRDADRFDKIRKKIENGELILTGEKKVTERVEGIGGSFTYCTLGESLDLDKMLTGESLPDYESLGSWLFHTATGEALPLPLGKRRRRQWYLGESTAFHVWLVYKPNLDFLKSRDSALTLSLAEKFAKIKGKKHLVFAPARYVPNKRLLSLGVEYAPLPFALYRVDKD